MSVVQKKWLSVVERMTYGIYVLTTCHRDTINGMIASWVSQISYDPPKVMVAVHPNRFTHQLISKSRAFALHLLRQDQQELIKRFKLPETERKFDAISWHRGKDGCPILEDCLAYMECKVTEAYSPGNHTLFIGEILDGKRFADDHPMSTLDYQGFYMGRE